MVSQSSDASSGNTGAASANSAAVAPQINLPKGGGAIRGIGEKFAANPVTGTGSVSFPIYTSPGRSGFGPRLSLSYDSGSGNSPFGFGWSLALPEVTRKTDKGLPQYQDAQESDTFILSGVEDLVPFLVEAAGQWTRDVTPARTVYGKQYAIHRYRPRVEGLFARIERWVNLSDPQDTCWRSISKDNITTWYGKTPESRVADPADPSRIFSWLISQSYDDKGNIVVYGYKPEDSIGIDLTQVNERNRTDGSRSANRYLKHVFYGNATPYFPDLTAGTEVQLPKDWFFELAFDYGEHDLPNPIPQETGVPWDCRLDPFSTYRATFEVRTYRLCRRALMFHHFPAEPHVGLNCLVRSTDLTHTPPTPPLDPAQQFYSYLLSATQTGYSPDGTGGYVSNTLPPLEFEYTTATVDETVREVDPESLKNLPNGLDGSHYRWADLDGEGLSGILTEQAGSWFYKANLSPVNRRTLNGVHYTSPLFAPVAPVARQPSLTALNGGRQQLLDLSGNGRLDLVDFQGPTPGYFERTEDADWEAHVTFRSLPIVDWRNPELNFVDLTGDGFADLLVSEGDDFLWYNSLATEGFASRQQVPQSFDEEKGPRLVFSDSTESIFLADLSGDGLSDLVRIRNGEVCYWPNLGYGRFGAKVTMDHAPLFDRADIFDGRRIQLADIDGSGTADIIYLAGGSVQLYFNQSGNGWSAARSLSHFPRVDSTASITALDLLGNGTACLVWSSPLPGSARRPMRYIDLMGGNKPHLLVHVSNNLGAETVVTYAPSTKFYIADKLAGTPWVTRLPFPVHVVEQVRTYDYVSRNLFVTRYAYHHGYFDGVEREFRGFGRVDQWDTEEFATLANSTDFPKPTNVKVASNVPPAFTKTWFHTGVYFGEPRISRHFEHEYYSEARAGLTTAQAEAMLLPDTVLPATILHPDGTRIPSDFSPEELREACRALRGSILRQEVYGLDGTDAADRPYSVSERNYTIETFQPQGPNRFGVFFSHPREAVDFHYERRLFKVLGNQLVDPSAPPSGAMDAADPRVSHTLTLAVDQFGNVLQTASVGYGRRYLDPALSPSDQAKQSATLSTCTQAAYTNGVQSDDTHRTPLLSQSSTYELIQVQPAGTQVGVTNLFSFDELLTTVQGLDDGLHDILYEDFKPTGLAATQPYRRLLERTRTYYRPDDLGEAAGNPTALLALGTAETLALPGTSYKLAFTPGLISRVYQRGSTALLPTPASVLGSLGPDGGGYVDLDGDGHWWIPGWRVYYLQAAPSSPQERNQALQHFFQPRRFEDPFGSATSVDHDPYDLLAVQTTDALGNAVTAVNDYRVLAPALITDPNGNRSAASYDSLGLVTAAAVMGKPGLNQGDLLAGFSADLKQTQIDGFYDAIDPHTVARPLLGNATTRVVYDVHRFLNSRIAAPTDPSKWQPAFAATISREIHFHDLEQNQQSALQISFSYSDGFGRKIQKKVQAEPGPVADKGPDVNPRWVGSGWTIFNNKGKPVRQYEPFFSQLPSAGHQFEFGVQVGVSPILCYDPVERVVATIHPNRSYEKVVFDPWHQATWDPNDTVLQTDPTADPDVGGFFQRLPVADYSPTWYMERAGGGLGLQEQDAASKASAHANTPAIAYFDTLGRTFLTIADNATTGKYSTHVDLDIQGYQRSVTDALDRKVMVYDYDMPGGHIHQASMEAGERWMLNDVTGKPIRAWDSRAHNFRTAYDPLRRPMDSFLMDGLGVEITVRRVAYGESLPTPEVNNLRGKPYQVFDQAGVVTSGQYDFKGNLLQSQRQLAQVYNASLDWSGPVPLEAGIYTSSTVYDALNRALQLTSPDNSIILHTYNEANLLERVDANLQGAQQGGLPVWTPFVTNIDYDAKGQRRTIAYGNGVTTAYTYDPLTFRMVHMRTLRGGDIVQDLQYNYDPVGNVTHIGDAAQQTIYFSNTVVTASADYIYDALYRLITATGREHLGQVGPQPAPTSYNDFYNVGLPQPGNGNAMGTYVERYQYDPAGNFQQVIHRGSNPISPGWTRDYAYQEPSQLEVGKMSNRLSTATIGLTTETYSSAGNGYDTHGNMLRMPQLQIMQWNFKDQLQLTQRQAVNPADSEGVAHQGERTWYVYDGSGQRARKVTESATGGVKDERIYLGNFEIYNEPAKPLARQTLHVMDDKKRIAVVETRSQGTDASPAQLIRYQCGNHLGSACLELDDIGGVISYEEYYPYGSSSYQAKGGQAEVPRRYRYTGMERDEESGFCYHSARYYAPWLGRWTAPDPSGFVDGSNLFAYCRGRPTSHVDPTGKGGTDTKKQQKSTAEPGAKAGPAAVTPSGGTDRMTEKMSEADIRNEKLFDAAARSAKKLFGAFLFGKSFLPGVEQSLSQLLYGYLGTHFSDRKEKYLTPAYLFWEHIHGNVETSTGSVIKNHYFFIQGDEITKEAKHFEEVQKVRDQVHGLQYKGGKMPPLKAQQVVLKEQTEQESEKYIRTKLPEEFRRSEQLHALLGSFTLTSYISSITSGVALVHFTLTDTLSASSTSHFMPGAGEYLHWKENREEGAFKTIKVTISWDEEIQTSGDGSGVAPAAPQLFYMIK